MSLARVFVRFHATCHIYGKLRTLWIVDGQITMVINSRLLLCRRIFGGRLNVQ